MRRKKVQINNYFKYLSLSSIVAIVFIFFTLRGSTSDRAMYLSLGVLVVWIFIAFFSQPTVFLNSITTKPMILFYSFLLFYLVTAIFSAGPLYTAKLIGTSLIIFSPILLFEFYRRISLERLKAIVVISLFFGTYLIFKALIFYSTYDNAARRLASNELAYGDVAIGGGYAMAYAVTILSIYLFDLILNKKIESPKLKLIILISLLISTFFVIETKSTLTIVWLLVGYSISYISKNNYGKKNSKNKKTKILFYMKILSSIFIVIFLILIRKDIGSLILNVTSDNLDVLSLRIRDIGYALTSGVGNSGQLALRLEIPMKSVNAFLTSPIIGRGYEYGYRAVEAYNYIGGHGEWVDALGKYGLIGSLFYFSIFVVFIRKERRISREIIPPTYVIVFVLLGLFNPLINCQSMFAMLFLIPSLSLLLVKNIDNKENMKKIQK